jgi:hypothetical protein
MHETNCPYRDVKECGSCALNQLDAVMSCRRYQEQNGIAITACSKKAKDDLNRKNKAERVAGEAEREKALEYIKGRI